MAKVYFETSRINSNPFQVCQFAKSSSFVRFYDTPRFETSFTEARSRFSRVTNRSTSHNSRIASPLSPFKNNVENRVHCSASLFHSERVAMSCSVNRWYFFSGRSAKRSLFGSPFFSRRRRKKIET